MVKNRSNGTLSPKQTKAISLLIAGETVTAAAEGAGVGVRTVYSWFAEPGFQSALREAQAGLIGAAQSRLVSGQQKALAALESLLGDSDTPPGVRRQAAEGWLNLLWRYKENGEFENRLKILEERLGANGQS